MSTITASYRYINERKLAAMLNVRPATLRKWRMLGRGPEFRRIGRSVRYQLKSIEAWIASRSGGGENFESQLQPPPQKENPV